MYIIKRTRSFERSYKKLKASGKIKPTVIQNLTSVIDIISKGIKLDLKFKDHALNGDFDGYRECYIKGDLLLIYKLEQKELILILVDIGSHSYLF